MILNPKVEPENKLQIFKPTGSKGRRITHSDGLPCTKFSFLGVLLGVTIVGIPASAPITAIVQDMHI